MIKIRIQMGLECKRGTVWGGGESAGRRRGKEEVVLGGEVDRSTHIQINRIMKLSKH
jgi:hypothetical protein